ANGARVINLSIGSPQGNGADMVEQTAIEFAIQHGVVVVAAAGNESASTIDYPAAYPGVISVGASALNDNNGALPYPTATEYVAPYSNAGPGLGLVAPGGDPSACQVSGSCTVDNLQWIENLTSTTVANPGNRCTNSGGVCAALFAGTSQATPHVVGAAALLLAVNSAFGPAQIAQILESTADDIRDPHQGAGRLNVYRALAAATGDPSPPAQPTALNFVAFAYGNSGGTKPQIIDVTFTTGVAVNSDGTFRLPDIPANAANYKIGVWYDANGNGIVDAGDDFGASTTCPTNAPCSANAGSITAAPVPPGFTLP
ncbi:MAG: S8 family serine peptidase, partial [Vulcanimicrobiaceae bacterium]